VASVGKSTSVVLMIQYLARAEEKVEREPLLEGCGGQFVIEVKAEWPYVVALEGR
jgi:hypothetical protein